LLLPFQVVDELKWYTAPAVALVSFTLFGIEAIGVEIENPFGTDPNDLPLDAICNTIQGNVNDLIGIEPHYRRSSAFDGSFDDRLN
jgi:putative membrane protein